MTNSEGESVWTPYRTTLVPLASEDFVAVVGNTATVVRPPTGRGVGDAPPDEWPGSATSSGPRRRSSSGWASPSGCQPGRGPVPGLESVLLATDLPEGGSLLVDGAATAEQFGSHGQFSDDCDAVDAGASLSAVPTELRAHPDPRQPGGRLHRRLTPGSQLAVVRAGVPIEVLSTAPADELP